MVFFSHCLIFVYRFLEISTMPILYKLLQFKTIRDAYRTSRESPQASCEKHPIWAWFRKIDSKGESNLAVFLENWFDRGCQTL